MRAVCRWVFIACILLLNGTSCLVEDDRYSENDILTEDVENWFGIDDEDADLTVPQLVTKYGFNVEHHMVTTEDDYILTMFRILAQPNTEDRKYPVLMVHGLLASSADFVICGPNNSLAYLLADNGYEVWLANVRGSRYSRAHTSLPVDSKEYWDFSWHEMGYYDIPAMIDYILRITSAAKVNYIGHSQGTTVYFAMSSSRPEYNDKVALMTALSPAVVVKRVRTPVFRLLFEISAPLKDTLDSLNIYEFFPYSRNNYNIAKSVCPKGKKNNFCSQLIAHITGPHPEMYDQTLGLAYLGHSPAGASTKQIMHYVQLARTGLFRQYDYGKKENLQVYSNWKPPSYNLTASSAPVVIFYALNDWIVHPRDVQQFAKLLPRVVSINQVADKKFNHIDFITAKNARPQVYEKLIPLLEEYNRVSN